ncbi:6-phosphogluconate dehydrogenase-like protein [Aspergillus granulosus]|uniref:6-phosphogluconate dehydrogenase-like protein n=1 Tax=Aspergillus granulosus TaxID=176169 RepID=A0ABR4HMG6_9EURO
MAPRVTFMGLGPMGLAMSENLLRYGDIEKPLVLYNRTREKAEAHSSRLGNCQVADSVANAVLFSDIIWLCLQDQKAIEETFQKILSTDIRGKLFVDSSTTSPEMVDSIAQRVSDGGGHFVAVPVMGGPPLAISRSLTCIASGDSKSVDTIRPYLEGVVGSNIVDLSGENPGAALLLKLMGNFLIMATIETVAEAHAFAETCGIGTKNMDKLMAAVFPRPPHALYNHQMLSGECFSGKPLVEVSKALLLTGRVMELAQKHGASVKIYEIAREHLKFVKDHEGPDADITAIYGAVRVESGLPFRPSRE